MYWPSFLTCRRFRPEDEQINIPANPHHYWRYRMPVSLESLIASPRYADAIAHLVQQSGR